MTIAVIGSRNYSNFARLSEELDKYDIGCIVSGGARGADSLARRYANERNIRMVEHLPDYAKYQRRAPLVRNELIIADADLIIAFWDGVSSGTAHAIGLARKNNKKIIVIND